MERTLTQFIRALRSAGAPVSSAESIDAARALALVGFEDRDRMKETLGVVLAKTVEEKELHDELFESFFSSVSAQARDPRGGRDGGRDAAEGEQQEGAQNQDGSDPGASQAQGQPGSQPQGQGQQGQRGGGSPSGGSGEPGDDDPLMSQGDSAPGGMGGAAAFVELANSNDPNRIAVAMERAGAAAGVDDIRFAHQTAWYVSRMLDKLGVGALEARLGKVLQDSSDAAQAEAQTLIDARARMRRHARAHVDHRFELFGRSATESFLNDVVINREIGQLGVRDMDRMKVLVAKMAKRLAVRHSRRRRVRNRGQLDIRRTMRANAGHDGVPIELVWKRKRKDRPKIVAICDVSGSVARYVRFLLLFLHTLKDEVPEIDAFAFSAELRDVGHDLGSMSFEKAMEHIIFQVGGGATDYGQALAALKAEHFDLVDRRTTVLILGDGRSNRADPRLDLFQELADRAKRVVWLCPEPESQWGSGDSCMLQYQPYCTHMSHCVTAVDLERALDDVLSAYD